VIFQNPVTYTEWYRQIAIVVLMLELVATTSELEASLASRPLSSSTEKETPCSIATP